MPCTLGVSGLFVFLKDLNFFSFFSSMLRRKIKIHAGVFIILIMIPFKDYFFPNKKSCCVHVYMMFDSVWSLKINFMRKLSLGISSYSEITGFACDRAFQIPALSHCSSGVVTPAHAHWSAAKHEDGEAERREMEMFGCFV